MISGVTVGPGTYRQVTVNRRGIVIAGYNPNTLSGYGITDAYTKVAVDSITADLADNITGVNQALSAAIGTKFDKAGGAVTGRITLTDGSNASPALRMNNTSWNTYLDLFRDQLRLYSDQGGSVIYPLVFDLTNKSASVFGGTVWNSINRPKSAASWGVNGWHRDSDTGKLEVWGRAAIEVPNAVGSVANLTVTFVTGFPVEVSSVTFGKVAGDASEVVENVIGFYNLTNSGMTITAKRVAGAQIGGERIIVHYRVFGR
jgi:phage-related tail fiber protein